MRLSRRTPASSETIIVLLKKTWDTERCGRDVAEFWPRWRAEMESRDGAEISRDQADVAEMSPPSCRAAAVARLCVLGVRARLAPRAGVGKVAGGPAQREAYK